MVLAQHSQARREVLKSMIKAIFAHQVAAFFKWLGQNSINEDQANRSNTVMKMFYLLLFRQSG